MLTFRVVCRCVVASGPPHLLTLVQHPVSRGSVPKLRAWRRLTSFLTGSVSRKAAVAIREVVHHKRGDSTLLPTLLASCAWRPGLSLLVPLAAWLAFVEKLATGRQRNLHAHAGRARCDCGLSRCVAEILGLRRTDLQGGGSLRSGPDALRTNKTACGWVLAFRPSPMSRPSHPPCCHTRTAGPPLKPRRGTTGGR